MVMSMTDFDNKGFSLIEVIIAMAIFAIGMGGLYAMQINSATGNSKANQQTGSVTAASQVIEQLMRTSYDDAALTRTKSPNGLPLAPIHECSAPIKNCDQLPTLQVEHAPYIERIEWDVIDLEDADPDKEGIKRVELTVKYRDGREVDIFFLRIKMI
jgi:prepilin-type N-terminal cleavage/methylation domain-containing protein